MVEKDAFLRELHHRVNNNFQIIASLMNLHKRTLPRERRDDIRFLEEHVQSMAVAYRLVIPRDDLVEVNVSELVANVLDSFRQIASAGAELVRLKPLVEQRMIGLNQAIALGLYLAVTVPPHLDQATALGRPMSVTMALAGDDVTIGVLGDWDVPVQLDFLRQRLLTAYIRQLRGATPSDMPPGGYHIRFQLEAPRSGWSH